MTFEEDYFDVPANTFEPDIIKLAQSIVIDPFKATEQKTSAWDYLLRWHKFKNG